MDSGSLIRKEEVINLHRPGVVAKFITYFLEKNWIPKEERKSLEILDALKFLDVINFQSL